jgi:type IV pilus assembly protein PilC
MPSFEWKGRDRHGNAQTGVLIGDNKDAVIAALRKQQIVVTTVKEKGKEIALPKFGGGISSKDVAVFTRQFSVMIDAGLPLVQCLEILGQQQDNKSFQKVILQVRQDVEGGLSLAEALRKHPQAFDDLYVNMVAAGEAGGILDTILQRLANYIEKNVKLKSQVRSALIYPVAVVTIAVIVVYVILWKVIPVFATLFEGLGASLPFLTQMVVNMSRFIGNFWWLIFLIVGGTIFGLHQYYQTDGGRYQIDKILLKLP